MKRTNLLKQASLIAVGLVLARGAQATITLIGDTTITFDNAGFPNSTQIPLGFASNASSTNAAVAGVSIGGSGLGLGTPDVALLWVNTPGGGHSSIPTQFQYFKSGPWDAAELFNTSNGQKQSILFNVPSFAAVSLNSFNFQPYYNNELFSFTVSVTDLTTSSVLSSQVVNFSSAPAGPISKTLVNLNVDGVLGHSLQLDLTRISGTGSIYDVAIDDIRYGESVPEPGTIALMGVGLSGMLFASRKRKK